MSSVCHVLFILRQITSPVLEESLGWQSRRTKVPLVGNTMRRWKNMSLKKVSFAHELLQSVPIHFPICFASCACCYHYFYILKTTRRDSGANLGCRRTGWMQAQQGGIMWRRLPSTPASRVGSHCMSSWWKLEPTGFLCILHDLSFVSRSNYFFSPFWVKKKTIFE